MRPRLSASSLLLSLLLAGRGELFGLLGAGRGSGPGRRHDAGDLERQPEQRHSPWWAGDPGKVQTSSCVLLSRWEGARHLGVWGGKKRTGPNKQPHCQGCQQGSKRRHFGVSPQGGSQLPNPPSPKAIPR